MKCKHEWHIINRNSRDEEYYCKYCLAKAIVLYGDDRIIMIEKVKKYE